MKIRYLLLPLLLLFSALSTAWAAGPVWRISKGDAELYLGGTIHVLGRADYPLPAVFDQAYAKAAKLVLETDLDQVKSSEFQQRMLQGMLLPDGRTLRDLLRPKTLSAVAAFLDARDMKLEPLLQFKPAMLDLVLTMGELRRLGLDEAGVDQFFQQRANDDHKELGGLESIDVQLAVLTGMGEGNEDAMINYTLGELKRLPELIQGLKAAWRRGDNAAMARLALTPWQRDFPGVYQELLVKRNRAWLPRIEALLRTPEVEMVLVGALHLVGRDGLLQQLADRGYTVEQL